jgi:hypothetical protein
MSAPSPGRPAPRRPQPSAAFDRVAKPDPRRGRPRDGLGKEALYTTAPTASPSPQVELRCRRCDVRMGVSILDVVRLLKPPFLYDPVRRRLRTRCPACEQRAWVELRAGQALRVLLERRPLR